MLPGSTDTHGEGHINRPSRMAQVLKAGFKDAVDIVYFIASGFTKIYKGKGRKLVLVHRTENQPVTSYIELAPSESGADYYDVVTAFPTNEGFLKNYVRTPNKQAAIDWKTGLLKAKDIDDISEVFR